MKELLCCAKLPKVITNPRTGAERSQRRGGVTRCSKGKVASNRCTSCSVITSRPEEVIKEVKVYNTGDMLKIEDNMNCKTKGFLYLVWSDKDPRVQYLGRSSRQVAERLMEHRRDIMENVKGKKVAEHFHRLRSKIRDFRFVPFKKIHDDNPHVIERLEKHYINVYNLVAKGINAIL